MRGFGNVYRRTGTRFWWIRYSVNGKPQYESSKSERREDAEELLKCRIEEREQRRRVLNGTLESVVNDYIENAKLRGVRAISVIERRARNALQFFGRFAKVTEIRGLLISEYQFHLSGSLSNATVNAAMSVLRSTLKLAHQHEYIESEPAFPRQLKKPPPRQGFLEDEDYLAISAELPDWGQDIFAFAYESGWRRNEVLWLTWDEVDWDARLIRLDAERSKNGYRRIRPITSDIEPVMLRRRSARCVGLEYVFHRDGKKIGITVWRNAFVKAREKAGRPNVLLHDCRRTTVRNLVRSGVVSDKEAMELTGHRTRSIFDRYDITSESDIIDAAERFARRTRK